MKIKLENDIILDNKENASHVDGTKFVSYEDTSKTEQFLKSQVPNTPEKPNTLNNETIDKKAMENAVRENLLSTYPPEEKITPVLKNEKTGENKIVTADDLFRKNESLSQKAKQIILKIGKYFNFRNLKRFTMASVFLGTTTAAMSQQGPNVNQKGDMAFAKTYSIKGNESKINILYDDAKKVKNVPQGYTMDRTEGTKTYYKKIINGTESPSKIKKAIPGSPATPGDGIKQVNWLIDQLKSGVSPEELIKNGHASAEGIKPYSHFYTPPATTVDVVYTENEKPNITKEADPFAAFATDGEMVYGPNKHATAEIFYAVRDTKSITDAGNLNTTTQDVLFRVRDDWGFKKEFLIMKSGDLQKYLGTGKEFQSQELYNEFLEKAKVFTENYHNNKSETKDTYSPEDLARGNK